MLQVLNLTASGSLSPKWYPTELSGIANIVPIYFVTTPAVQSCPRTVVSGTVELFWWLVEFISILCRPLHVIVFGLKQDRVKINLPD